MGRGAFASMPQTNYWHLLLELLAWFSNKTCLLWGEWLPTDLNSCRKLLCSRNCSTNRENISSVCLWAQAGPEAVHRGNRSIYTGVMGSAWRECFTLLVFSGWASLDYKYYSGIKPWKSSTGLKMLLQRAQAAWTYFCANSSIISTVQQGQRFYSWQIHAMEMDFASWSPRSHCAAWVSCANKEKTAF